MLKTEILELKKQFAKDSNIITRISGCYVDEQKEIKLISNGAFFSLSEDEAFKYEEIFRKTLSGNLGKHLLNLDFPLEMEREGGTQEFLLKLRDSELKDEELLECFYKKIIENLDYYGHYYIIVIDFAYDIPGKTRDGMTLEDASEEVYHAILCSICPVKLSKGSLKYYAEESKIENATRDWLVDAPMIGFVFPAFHDRTTDIHSLLYFTKKPENLYKSFIENMFKTEIPLPAMEQKNIIQESLVSALGEELDYLAIQELHENVLAQITENAKNPKPLVLDKRAMVQVLEQSGISQEAIEMYEKDISNDIEVMAENIIDKRKFEVKTAGISIKAEADYIYKIQTKMVGGAKCIVIPIEDNIEVNGVQVRS